MSALSSQYLAATPTDGNHGQVKKTGIFQWYVIVWWAREALNLILAKTLLNQASFLWNVYGPTETTIWSMLKQVISADAISLGRAIWNTQLYISQPKPESCPHWSPR